MIHYQSWWFFLGALALVLVGLWLYALISAIENERLDANMKIVWVIVIVFVSLVGAIMYLTMAPHRPSRDDRSWAEWRERKRRLRKNAKAFSNIPSPNSRTL